MTVISDVLRGPYGDIQPNVIITMQAKGTTARVLTSNRSSTVTDAAGKYSMTVFPGEYEVTVSTLGHVGDIRVLTDSVNGTLNDFLISPPKPDELTPEVVRTVDTMRAESAASAAAAKTSENNAAATLANAVKKGEFGIGGVAPAVPLVDTLNAVKSLMSGKYVAWAGSEGMPRVDTAYMLDWTLASASSGVVQGVVFATALITAPSSFDQVYRNVCRNGVFQGWKVMWDDNSLSNAMRVGDYGLGTSYPIPSTDPDADRTNQFFRWAAGVSGTPGATQSWAGVQGGYDTNARWQLAWSQGSTGFDLATRVRATAGAWSPVWAKIWHTANTTVDANGFIKKASPIVKLFGDGRCELNDESQGVTTERVSEGVYRISGTLGFNADAEWGGVDGGIEIPTDRNKLPLVWVDYEVDETGDLLIKTFHRVNSTAPKFAQNVKTGYKEGQPIDIPAGRWIDLRVEMPGGDEPEYEPEVTEAEGGEEPAPGETPAPIPTEEPKE
ncbi:prophage tail fiber N-terminal domain-containing protein [Serratia sp. PL7]|uniref:prophage tail fiber N-terminal domain-containing protein n=1 Tax=Serratia sp. PL7 TaxID=2952201 RepID=UPI0021AE2048|nr:prophage tail fiber N-terminal domain-containing protein [Serratia sp. PL7]